ncbi:hypothetical protein P5705_09950 [Pseudomonas entomophila]|uniref:DUF6896 domain-containing protein n=1 Tax=Pseudomonas entomophila TaxID=312306 RepID=UPI0024060FA1|nr:hypothetical protein [Pseudomonas entomophila]MDF9617965.1 hypothetical protein [Pseudomonas entomophila]
MKKITEKIFLEIMESLSNTQQQLVEAYLLLAKNETHWPRQGAVMVKQEAWAFRKHGAGVCFEKRATGELVDAHDGMEVNPRKLDVWRVQGYLQSIEAVGIEIRGKCYNSHSDEDVELLLRLCLFNDWPFANGVS